MEAYLPRKVGLWLVHLGVGEKTDSEEACHLNLVTFVSKLPRLPKLPVAGVPFFLNTWTPFYGINIRVFRDSRFSLKKKAEPTKHKTGGHIERIQKDFLFGLSLRGPLAS